MSRSFRFLVLVFAAVAVVTAPIAGEVPSEPDSGHESDKQDGRHTSTAEHVVPRDTVPPTLLNVDEVGRRLSSVLSRWLRDLEIETTVIVQLVIRGDGKISDTALYETSGYTVIDSAVRRAIPTMKFEPATIDGKSVSANALLPVRIQSTVDSSRR